MTVEHPSPAPIADFVRVDRLGGEQGMYVQFDYGFGTNVHIGHRYHDGWDRKMVDREFCNMSIIGWEHLCELVDEYRARTARIDGGDA